MEKNYSFEKYFRLTSLSIHCIYNLLKTITKNIFLIINILNI